MGANLLTNYGEAVAIIYLELDLEICFCRVI